MFASFWNWLVAPEPPSIRLSPVEVQTGHDRVRAAECLILQLPKDHDGRNAWLLNYGISEPAMRMQAQAGLIWDAETNRTYHPAD